MLRTVRYHSQTVWGWFTRAHRVVPHLLPTHLAIIPPTHPTHQGYPPRLPSESTWSATTHSRLLLACSMISAATVSTRFLCRSRARMATTPINNS